MTSEQKISSKFLKQVHLYYSTDEEPGLQRRRHGKTFTYLDEKGHKIKKPSVLKRIHKLVIPPAWKSVWICKKTNGHIQVTGRDDRGRKQYKYHPDWTVARNEVKFEKLADFGKALKKLRARVRKDLQRKGLPKEKVIATVLKLMEETHIRVGNDVYAKENNSYGLTTLTNQHVQIKGSHIRFHFKGKSGVVNTTTLQDPRLSKIIKKCQDLPGQELFGYQDSAGQAHDITSDDVNSYIREATGEDLTAKDFRTWGGSVAALEILLGREGIPDLSETGWKKFQVEIVKATAKVLGNTVAVCRKYYIHPKIFETARKGTLSAKLTLQNTWRGLRKPEQALLALLKAP